MASESEPTRSRFRAPCPGCRKVSPAVAIAIVVLVVLLALLLLRGSADQTRALRDVHERLGALGEATKRLETMGTAVTEVQQLLQVPKLRGTLGEVWLQELLRQILPGSHYQMQHVFRSGERSEERRVGKECRSRWSPDH